MPVLRLVSYLATTFSSTVCVQTLAAQTLLFQNLNPASLQQCLRAKTPEQHRPLPLDSAMNVILLLQ